MLLAAASRSANRGALDLELGVLLVVPLFALVIPITTLILASSALGDERRDKTLSFLVLRPISRLEIACAKTRFRRGRVHWLCRARAHSRFR